MKYYFNILRLLTCVLLLAVGACVPDKKLHETPIVSQLFVASVPETRMTLVFSGDYMQHLPQVYSASRANGNFDYGGTLMHLSHFYKQADFAIVNFETTIADSAYRGFPCFRSPAASMSYLKKAGVDIVALANNHCCDYGVSGIRKTLATADSCGLRTTGVYEKSHGCRLLVLEKENIRVALLNYTYSTNGLPVPEDVWVNKIDTALIAADIADAYRYGATDVILFYHWGEEYQAQPQKAQRRLASWSRSKGVSLIVGAHPHVVQPIEVNMSDDSVISDITVYSLGNLISNQSDLMSRGGISFSVDLVKRGNEVTRYENPACLMHWVDVYWSDGRKHYQVIPVFDRDSLLRNKQMAAKLDSFTYGCRMVMGEMSNLRLITSYP